MQSSYLFSNDEAALWTALAKDAGVSVAQVKAFVHLYDDGATVPFIARYRKDKTGALDDKQLRKLQARLEFYRTLNLKKDKVLQLLRAQNVQDEHVFLRLKQADTKVAVDEIYEPFRPKKKSLAAQATEAGLDVVADKVLNGASIDIALQDYAPKAVDIDGQSVIYDDADAQKQGVLAIIVARFATDLDMLTQVRKLFAKTANIVSTVTDEAKPESAQNFSDYLNHKEPLAKLPNHRLLAMLRGRQKNVLSLSIEGDDSAILPLLLSHFGADDSAHGQFIAQAVHKLWQEKWSAHIKRRLLTERRILAEQDATGVFADNLQHLLMQAPVGMQTILGVDPGIRHGIKMAVIAPTGSVLAHATVYAFDDDAKKQEALDVIKMLIDTHKVSFVAVGNGTKGRESYAMVKQVVQDHNLPCKVLMISEAGASVYSASQIASDELPDLDVSVRGAVSIARRLQDPLSELVKVDAKSIGVGQYQHDINQVDLQDALDKVIEDCVNKVGVDVNTASAAILTYVAGLGKNVAEQIVNYRSEHGAFKNREALKNVPRLGDKTFLQAAGFLRINDGDETLDKTGVHPESYAWLKQALSDSGIDVNQLLCQKSIHKGDIAPLLSQIGDDLDKQFVIDELLQAGRDPRGDFVMAQFDDSIQAIDDLTVGMQLEGVVTNVTSFGCFVDIGIHQDGLVHISQIKDGFIQNMHDVIKPFDIVTVWVSDVDAKRGRISLSMKNPSHADTLKTKDSAVDTKPKAKRQKRNHTNAKAKSVNKSSAHRPKAPKTGKIEAKIGSLGMLLQKAMKDDT